MTGPADILRAQTEARLARMRLGADAAELRERLRPANAVADLRARAGETAADLRDRAVGAARRRPIAVAGGLALLAAAAAFGPVRRIAGGIGRAAWRNRAAIGRFIETKRLARKDPPS